MITDQLGHLAAILVSSLIAAGYLFVVLAIVLPPIVGGAYLLVQLAKFARETSGQRGGSVPVQNVVRLRPAQYRQGRGTLEPAC